MLSFPGRQQRRRWSQALQPVEGRNRVSTLRYAREKTRMNKKLFCEASPFVVQSSETHERHESPPIDYRQIAYTFRNIRGWVGDCLSGSLGRVSKHDPNNNRLAATIHMTESLRDFWFCCDHIAAFLDHNDVAGPLHASPRGGNIWHWKRAATHTTCRFMQVL